MSKRKEDNSSKLHCKKHCKYKKTANAKKNNECKTNANAKKTANAKKNCIEWWWAPVSAPPP